MTTKMPATLTMASQQMQKAIHSAAEDEHACTLGRSIASGAQHIPCKCARLCGCRQGRCSAHPWATQAISKHSHLLLLLCTLMLHLSRKTCNIHQDPAQKQSQHLSLPCCKLLSLMHDPIAESCPRNFHAKLARISLLHQVMARLHPSDMPQHMLLHMQLQLQLYVKSAHMTTNSSPFQVHKVRMPACWAVAALEGPSMSPAWPPVPVAPAVSIILPICGLESTATGAAVCCC